MKTVLLLALLFLSTGHAAPFFSVYGGTTVPKVLSNQQGGEQATLNLGMEFGALIENHVGIGCIFDMNFKNTLEDVLSRQDTSTAGGVFETYYNETGIRRRQFSFGLGFWINPLDSSLIRPVIRASFLPSMMLLINDYDTTDTEEVLPPSGAYWGYIGDLGADIHIMISDRISFFVGSSYRYGSVKKRINYDFWNWEEDEEYQYLRHPMQGPQFRAGLMLW